MVPTLHCRGLTSSYTCSNYAGGTRTETAIVRLRGHSRRCLRRPA